MDIEQPRRTKRRHSEEFKRTVVRACSDPGVSVAGVAMAHGVNANLVRKWLAKYGVAPASRRRAGRPVTTTTVPMPACVPVQVTPALEAAPTIRIEVAQGHAAVTVHWPLQAADACCTWLRELLR